MSKTHPAVHSPKKIVRHRSVTKAAPTVGHAPVPLPVPAGSTKKTPRRARKAPGSPPDIVPASTVTSSTASPSTPPTALPSSLAPTAVTALPSLYASLVVQPPEYDPTAGEAAFAALASNRAAIPADKLVVAHVDVQAAALVALRVCGFVAQVPELQTQFQALDTAGLFLVSTLTDLQTAALAALYAFSQAEAAGAFDTATMVPPVLIAQASAVEKRMQTRCEYLFANDPTVSPLLDMLRPGIGYNDLANDLLGYASIYAGHASQVAAVNDPNYVATDLADAQTYAGQILGYLTAAMGPAVKGSYDQLQQSWTLLVAIYAEVKSVGLMLLRFDPKASTRFPSLTGAVRARKAKKGAPAPTSATTTPSTATPAATAGTTAPAASGGTAEPTSVSTVKSTTA